MKVYSSTTIPMMLMMTMSTSFLFSTQGGGVDAAHSWGLSYNNKEKSSEVEIDASASAAGATKINSDSIHDITHSQKRFVLYNSRRLTGECRK